MTRRLFLAIRPSGAILEELSGIQQEFRRALAEPAASHGVRWTPRENLHVTLHFLGDTADDRLIALHERLAAWDWPPRHAQPLAERAWFPMARRARVLGLGAASPVEPLKRLHEGLAKELTSLGYSLEQRAYHPHVTLARFREALDARRLDAGLVLPEGPGLVRYPVDAVTLYSSRLGAGGSAYEILEEYPLAPVQ